MAQFSIKSVISGLPFKIIASAAAVIILAAIIWAAFGKRPAKVEANGIEANGIIVCEREVSTVSADKDGIISDVLVSEGDQVSAGQEIARLNSDDEQKQLDELLEGRDSVDKVTFYSENDVATDDNKDLLGIKAQWSDAVSELNTNKDLLKTKEKELEDQKKKVTEAKDTLDKAKKAYDATTEPVDTTSQKQAYDDASSELQTAKQNQESAESALTQAQKKVDDLLEQRKPLADDLESAQKALSEAEADCKSAENYMDVMESYMETARDILNDAKDAYQYAEPGADLAALYEAEEAARISYENACNTYTDAQKACNTAIDKKKDAEKKVDDCQKTVDGIDSKINEAKKELSSAQELADKCSGSLSTAQTAYDAAEKAYEDAKQAEAQRQSDNNKATADYQAATKAYNTEANKLSSAQDSVNQLKTQISNEEADLDKLKPDLILKFDTAKDAVLEQMDQDIDKCKQMIEDSVLHSTESGFISEINIAKGDTVEQSSVVCSVASKANAEKIVICYVPAAEVRNLTNGMRVEVCPSALNKQTYGYMEGTLRDVAKSVTPQEELRNKLGDDELVKKVTNKGSVVAVTVVLRTDPNTVSGFWWSDKKGAETALDSGTVITAEFVTKK